MCHLKEAGKKFFKRLIFLFHPKKIIHLKGRNGIGKTTLIKILVNMLSPTTGEIYWNGKNIKKNLYELFTDLTYIMDVQTSKNELTVSENIRVLDEIIFIKHKIKTIRRNF